ncbi:MAG: SprB repeat-containing protein [Flavobacteriales bacterium]|jgi:hypothetical protein|nr:SprB repeat-containing protein [Flavobacteriales bacterium]
MNYLRLLLFVSALFCVSIGHALEADIQQMNPSFCGASTGRLEVWVTGGVFPYSYSWSTGATGTSISGLTAGIYTVTVTDADQEVVIVQGEVEDRSYGSWYGDNIGPPQVQGWCADGTPYAYPYGAFTDSQGDHWTGPGPWNFTVNGQPTPTVPNACYNSWLDPEWYLPLDHAVDEVLTINYSDGNGCPGYATVTVKAPIPAVPLQVLSVSGSCNGLSQGSVVVATGAWVEPQFGISYYLGVAIRHAGGMFLSPECGVTGIQDAPTNGSVRTFSGLAPGDYEMVVRPSDGSMQAQPEFTSCQFVPFTIPDLGVNCGLVTGRAFMDYNLNCTRQTSEPYVPGGIVEILPGPYYASTSSQGLYSLALPTGSYTIDQQSEVLGEHCGSGPLAFVITAGATATVNLADTSSVPLDVQLSLGSGVARPGFAFSNGMTVRNLTPSASGAMTVTFTFDPLLGYRVVRRTC